MDQLIHLYCVSLDKVGTGLTMLGNGAHHVYDLCGQGLYWVSTLGGMCCPK